MDSVRNLQIANAMLCYTMNAHQKIDFIEASTLLEDPLQRNPAILHLFIIFIFFKAFL